jgi:hypothetical protein
MIERANRQAHLYTVWIRGEEWVGYPFDVMQADSCSLLVQMSVVKVTIP